GQAAGVRLRDGREWNARLAIVSNVDPYSTFIEMMGEDKLPNTFAAKIKSIEPDEFSYFQVHLALKAPVRYAIHEANDAAVGQAMNVNIGPEKPDHFDEMWKEIRAGEFPSTPVCTRSVPPCLTRSRRRRESMRRLCSCRCRFS